MSYIGRSSKLVRKAQEKISFLATAGQTVKTGLSYTPTSVEVTVNGILLTDVTDYTASNGNSVTFLVALALNDEVTLVSHKTFTVADTYSKADANTLLAAKATTTALATTTTTANAALPKAGGTMTGSLAINSPNQASGGTALQIRQGNATSFGIDMGLSQSTGHLNISRVNSNNATHMMTLARDTGNVGVGTASPAKPLDVTGDIRTSGNLVIGTNGKGIDFSSNADSSATGASTTSELLDDYEEGTWTANASQYSVGISTTGAYYRKVGTLVHVNIYLNIASTSATNGVLISGLPFAALGSNNHSYLVGRSNQGAIICQVNAGGSAFDMRLVASDANKTFANMSGSYILISGTYVSA